MTCIVGYVEDDKVYMGADSCGSNGHTYAIYPRKKIFIIKNRFLIGCTGSYRMMDLLEFSFNPPALKEKYNPSLYMRTDFIDTLRTVFKDKGFMEIKDGKDRGGNFLVGFDGNLFEIQSDLSVLDCPNWGHSVGSGEEAACAVLYHLKKDKIKSQIRLEKALTVAEGIITSVKGPFYFESIGTVEWKFSNA